MNKYRWEEQYKIRCKESSMSQAKHLVVKSLLVLILKTKHKKAIIETEKAISEGIICDVYFEDKENKICYEVQKECTPQYIKETVNKYSKRNYLVYIIPIKELPDDLNELIKELEEFIV